MACKGQRRAALPIIVTSRTLVTQPSATARPGCIAAGAPSSLVSPSEGAVPMGHRTDLWKMLAESATETISAMNEHIAASSPDTRARVDTTFSEYIACLAPIIGETAAFQLHASWQVYMDSLDRRTRLLAALAGRSNITEADVETVQQLQSEAE